MSNETPVYVPPKKATLGEIIDELGRRYEKRKTADAVAAKLKAEEEAVRDYLFTTASKADLDGARGKLASIAIVETVVPALDDWDKFYAFAKKKGNDDLLQRSVSSPAWRERINDKKAVPGVSAFTRTTLRLTMLKKGK